jgi:hypothetical protein
MTYVLLPGTLVAAVSTKGTMPQPQLVHTHEIFEFVANAEIDTVFPLFGGDKERLWAPDWAPTFVWPAKAVDQQGMIFKVGHGDRTGIWVNTLFDRPAKAVQYVYVIPDIVVTVISLKLIPGTASTAVSVSYDRTALTAAANDLVNEMAAQDRSAGPEWGRQINDYLSGRH